MVERCTNPKSINYTNYGGRGITVCNRWLVFENFYTDVGQRPSVDHSIDRIDNDRGYEPGNVRWAVKLQQAKNTRHNRIITVDGVSLTLGEWAKKIGCAHATLRERIDRGWDLKRAVTEAPNLSRQSHGEG
jgi:hypothetical protein